MSQKFLGTRLELSVLVFRKYGTLRNDLCMKKKKKHMGNVHSTWYTGAFAWRYYLFGCTNSPLTFHSKRALLRRFNVTSKIKTFWGLQESSRYFFYFNKIWNFSTYLRKIWRLFSNIRTYLFLHIKCPKFLPDFNQMWTFSTDLQVRFEHNSVYGFSILELTYDGTTGYIYHSNNCIIPHLP
jgi:hypothetical protein